MAPTSTTAHCAWASGVKPRPTTMHTIKQRIRRDIMAIPSVTLWRLTSSVPFETFQKEWQPLSRRRPDRPHDLVHLFHRMATARDHGELAVESLEIQRTHDA